MTLTKSIGAVLVGAVVLLAVLLAHEASAQTSPFPYSNCESSVSRSQLLSPAVMCDTVMPGACYAQVTWKHFGSCTSYVFYYGWQFSGQTVVVGRSFLSQGTANLVWNISTNAVATSVVAFVNETQNCVTTTMPNLKACLKYDSGNVPTPTPYAPVTIIWAIPVTVVLAIALGVAVVVAIVFASLYMRAQASSSEHVRLMNNH